MEFEDYSDLGSMQIQARNASILLSYINKYGTSDDKFLYYIVVAQGMNQLSVPP